MFRCLRNTVNSLAAIRSGLLRAGQGGLLHLALALVLLVAAPHSLEAQQTITLDDVTYTEITDSERGIRFLVPDTAGLTRGEPGNPPLSAMAGEGQRLLQVEWENRVAFVDAVPIGFDFIQMDWLLAQATLQGQEIVDLATVTNETGLLGGRITLRPDVGSRATSVGYLFVVDRAAYHIHGASPAANVLVDRIAARFASDWPDPWDALDFTQQVVFGDLDFDVRAEFEQVDVSNDNGTARVIADRANLAQARILLILKNQPGATGNQQGRAFFQEMVGLGFVPDLIEESDTAVTLDMMSSSGRPYRGYFVTDGRGTSVGLVTPWVTAAPVLWLAARKAFADALAALE